MNKNVSDGCCEFWTHNFDALAVLLVFRHKQFDVEAAKNNKRSIRTVEQRQAGCSGGVVR